MITAHVMVRNEENFIWYSITSVIHSVDRVLICDTGSNDKTINIIDELMKKYPKKILYRQIGIVDKNSYSDARQKMLDETKEGWILILDADEIYFQSGIKEIANEIKQNGEKYDSIIVPTINLVGDMFHYQEESAGKYKFGNRVGHYALRFINKNISGLHIVNEYGKEGFADSEGKSIQDRDLNKQKFINTPYIHTTHLVRSSKDKDVMQRSKKLKYEIGKKFAKDFYYPESFFMERPILAPNIWKNMDRDFKVRAFFETPLRKLKRRIG